MTETGYAPAKKYDLEKTNCGSINPKNGDVCSRLPYHTGDHIPSTSDFKKRDKKKAWPNNADLSV